MLFAAARKVAIGTIPSIHGNAACRSLSERSGHWTEPRLQKRIYEYTPLARSPESGRLFRGSRERDGSQTLLSPAAPVGGFNARRSVGLNEQESAGWQMRLNFWRAG